MTNTKLFFLKDLFLKFSLSAFCLLMTLSVSAQNRNTQQIYGVWANSDCEFVQTGKYSILFQRTNDTISATLRKIEQINGIKYSVFVSGHNFFVSTKKCEKIVPSPQRNKIKLSDFLFLKDNKLTIKDGSRPVTVELVEKIDICPPFKMPLADTNTVGQCLQYWQLGTAEKSLDPKDFWLEIGTNRHVFVFIENPHQVYCRAARIRHNNNGSVFAQNIRLMVSQSNTDVYMSKDNVKTAKADINIDNSLFKPNVCSFENDGIYWSFISCEPDKIKVNGCGQVYTFERPTMNDKKLIEWFKYSGY